MCIYQVLIKSKDNSKLLIIINVSLTQEFSTLERGKTEAMLNSSIVIEESKSIVMLLI